MDQEPTGQSIQDFSAALIGAAESAESIVQQSDALFDVSGATGVVQEFQQRADRVRQAATSMAGAADASVAAALAEPEEIEELDVEF